MNCSSAGQTDIEPRIVVRQLPKYLQAVRTIDARNVVGAGGSDLTINELQQ